MSQVSDAFKQRDREILGIQYPRAVAATAAMFDHAAGMARFRIYLIVLAAILFDGPANRIGLFLGSASYSIYLFHPHFESATLSVWSKIAPATPIGLVVFAVSLVAIVASSLVYIFVELPVVRVSQRLLLGSREDRTKRSLSRSTTR